MKCRQCGIDLPEYISTDICLECSKKNLQETFHRYPELKEAYKETIRELNTPEVRDKIVKNGEELMKRLLETREAVKNGTLKKIPDGKEPCRRCEYANCFNDDFCECRHPLTNGSKVQISVGCIVKLICKGGIRA